MSQYLPYANVIRVKNINEIEQKLMKIKSNSWTGYTLEVDLEYPKELHLKHSDYPLAPEKTNIWKEWLTDYCLEFAYEHNITRAANKKLMPKKWFIIYIYNNDYRKD